MYTSEHKNHGYLFLSFLALCLAFELCSPTGARGDKWQIVTFTDDLEKDIAAFEEFCFLHDLSSEDVLWANNCTADDIVPGIQLRLPVSQIDLLSLWQNRGAWQPKALVPVTSAALAERTRTKHQPNAQSTQTQTTQVSQVTPPPTRVSAQNSQITPTPALAHEPVKPKPMTPTRETPAEAIAKTTARPNSTSTSVPALTEKPETSTIGPSSVSMKSVNTEAKNNPVLVLAPDGDASSGPMRLVISGDHVEVVRLPKEARPKTPSLADLNQPLGTSTLYEIMYGGSLGSSSPGVNIPAGAKMMWPVNGKVSSSFGVRSGRKHDGLDIPMPLGTEIRAAQEGRVILTGTNSTPGFRGYGNFALIDHGRNICTLYSHCNTVDVKKGQYVRKGQVIATVGQTGRASTTHVHFEVRVNGKAVDPKPYLDKQ